MYLAMAWELEPVLSFSAEIASLIICKGTNRTKIRSDPNSDGNQSPISENQTQIGVPHLEVGRVGGTGGGRLRLGGGGLRLRRRGGLGGAGGGLGEGRHRGWWRSRVAERALETAAVCATLISKREL